jgi:hypothetical protein
MYTSRPRAKPVAVRMPSNNLPADPTKGSPCSSSSAPGPSPTKSQGALAWPTPSTACLRSLHKAHALQSRVAVASASHDIVMMDCWRASSAAVGAGGGALVRGMVAASCCGGCGVGGDSRLDGVGRGVALGSGGAVVDGARAAIGGGDGGCDGGGAARAVSSATAAAPALTMRAAFRLT